MKGWLRLYPADWRERYGEEVEALLEEHHLSLLDMLDVLRGAIDAWIHPIGSRRQGMILDIGRWAGLSLILAAMCWSLFVAEVQSHHGWISMTPGLNDTGTQVVLFLVSSLAFVLALLGFTGFWLYARQRRRGSRLGEISLTVTVVACLMFVVGYALFIVQGFDTGAASYSVMSLGLTLFMISMLLHGLAAAGARLLPAWSTVPLILSPLLMAFLPVLFAIHREGTVVPLVAVAAGLVLALSLSVSWVALGVALVLSGSYRAPLGLPVP